MNSPLYVIDFEGSLQSGVLEAGVVCLENNLITQCFTRLYTPHATIHKQETQCHGLTEHSLKNVSSSFREEFERYRFYRTHGLLGAHHAPVEESLLRHYWPHPGVVPSHYDSHETHYTWGPWVDSLQLYKHFYPGLPSYALMDLIQHFHLEKSLNTKAEEHCPAHRKHPHAALFDALATALLLQRLCQAHPGLYQSSLTLLDYSQTNATNASKLQQRELF